MTASSKTGYAKGSPAQPYRPGRADSAPDVQLSVDLRVTLGDMPLADAFEVTLPAIDPGLGAGELLERVFGPEGRREPRFRGLLDVRRNPDLHEMYDALLDVFTEQRDGRCVLRFFANHGPEIEPHDDIRRHLRVPTSPPGHEAVRPLLDVVIEQRYTPLDYAARRWHAGDERRLIGRLQERVLLHFIGHGGFRLAAEPESPSDRKLLPIAARLRESGDIGASGEPPAFDLTESGDERLARADAEVESAARLYDVFADVLYDGKAEVVEFGTGRGADLRVHVYEAEGIDTADAVLLRHLHDGTLDELQTDWRQAILEDDLFEELLIDLADRDNLRAEALERVIEAGLAFVEEREEELASLARRRDLEARVRRR